MIGLEVKIAVKFNVMSNTRKKINVQCTQKMASISKNKLVASKKIRQIWLYNDSYAINITQIE